MSARFHCNPSELVEHICEIVLCAHQAKPLANVVNGAQSKLKFVHRTFLMKNYFHFKAYYIPVILLKFIKLQQKIVFTFNILHKYANEKSKKSQK